MGKNIKKILYLTYFSLLILICFFLYIYRRGRVLLLYKQLMSYFSLKFYDLLSFL